MYTEYYRLCGRPFQLTPDPRFHVETEAHRTAMAYLTYGLSRAEGVVVVTGDAGTGKSLLAARLLSLADPDKLVAAALATTRVEAAGLLSLVLRAFGMVPDGMDKAQLSSRLEQFLRAHHREGRRVLLAVDEAQNLSADELEELRLLSNLEAGGTALLQLLLLGQTRFRARLNSAPDLEPLRQRVVASHHLGLIAAHEVAAYLEHRLGLVGWAGDPSFTEEAIGEMHRRSGGVARRLNALADRLLLYGALEQLHRIDADAVATVGADLERDMGGGGVAAALADRAAPPAEELVRRIELLEARLDAQERAIRSNADH